MPLLELYDDFTARLRSAGDYIWPLALRLIMFWEFWESGLEKLHGENWFATVPWADWQVGFPIPFNLLSPDLNWFTATWGELVLSVMILFGLFTRFAAFSLLVIYGNGQFGPFIVGQFKQERRVMWLCFVDFLQVAQKFTRQFREQRGLCAVLDKKITDHDSPLTIPVYFCQHREIFTKKSADVVVKQLPVNLHPAVFNAFRGWLVKRVADISRKFFLQPLQAFRRIRGFDWFHGPAISPVVGVCTRLHQVTPPLAGN